MREKLAPIEFAFGYLPINLRVELARSYPNMLSEAHLPAHVREESRQLTAKTTPEDCSPETVSPN
jgi:hypothetical protein